MIQPRCSQPDQPELRRDIQRPPGLLRQLGGDRGGHESRLRPRRGRDEAGLSLSGVTPTEGLSQTSVLSETTSGSVAQVTSLLSLEGSALDLAATLLTVSLVSVESESSGSAGAAAGASGAGPGAGQGSVPGQGNASSESDEESNPQAGTGPARAPEGSERPPIWERISIGLERAWEKARASILEAEGPIPAAENRKATVPPATGRTIVPPVPTPARPAAEDRTGAQAKPTPSSEAAIVAPLLPRQASFMPRQDDIGSPSMPSWETWPPDRLADGPSGRSGMELWDELAQARSPERTRPLVAMVVSAAVASAGWTLCKRGIQRRSVSIRTPLRRLTQTLQEPPGSVMISCVRLREPAPIPYRSTIEPQRNPYRTIYDDHSSPT